MRSVGKLNNEWIHRAREPKKGRSARCLLESLMRVKENM